MATDKVQRSFYVTEAQATWLKVTAAEKRTTVSEILGAWIDEAMKPKSDQGAQQALPATRKSAHDVLSKVAKQ
jgi:hypothetical protein